MEGLCVAKSKKRRLKKWNVKEPERQTERGKAQEKKGKKTRERDKKKRKELLDTDFPARSPGEGPDSTVLG